MPANTISSRSVRARLATARMLAVALVAVAAMAVTPTSAGATGHTGFNRVTSFASSTNIGNGQGSGWEALSAPEVNDPIVGYLFYNDPVASGAADHMDIFNGDQGATYPRGFAYGQYNACAYAYGFDNFYTESYSPHSGNCTPYSAGMAKADLFCSSGDAVCPAYGAWASEQGYNDGRPFPTTVPAGWPACPAFYNIGSASFGPNRASVNSTPTGLIGWLPAGVSFNIRYETKNRQYVLGKINGVAFPAPGSSTADMHWMFLPRVCIAA